MNRKYIALWSIIVLIASVCCGCQTLPEAPSGSYGLSNIIYEGTSLGGDSKSSMYFGSSGGYDLINLSLYLGDAKTLLEGQVSKLRGDNEYTYLRVDVDVQTGNALNFASSFEIKYNRKEDSITVNVSGGDVVLIYKKK